MEARKPRSDDTYAPYYIINHNIMMYIYPVWICAAAVVYLLY